MSALPSGSGVAARLAPAKPKTRGFLHIVRHGGGALEDILRLGSANIPDLWLSDEEILEKGLVGQ